MISCGCGRSSKFAASLDGLWRALVYERDVASTSVAELMDIVWREYRSMRTPAP
jgi:hypothetical protein